MTNPKKAHNGKYKIAEESYENKGKVLPANETSLEIAITVFTSDYPMSKRYCLDEKGNIIKKPAIPLSRGSAVTKVVDSLSEFAELRNNLTDNNATSYGTFKNSEVDKPVKVASSDKLDKYVDAIARTNEHMHYDRRYYSLLFIDIDNDDVSGLSIEEKRIKFYEVFPQFARASRVESPSSSSYIRNRLDANTPDSGLKGIHIYYVVKPEELPIICDIIKIRLINAGYSWTIKSSSEAVLIRTIIDLSVFNQPSRLDYPSRAIVEAPLVQNENKAIYKKGEYEVVSLDMFETLTEDEKNNYDKKISELKGKSDYSLVVQEAKTERMTRIVQNTTDEKMKVKLAEAINNEILPSDLELTTQSGETHTVGYFLEHSDEYDKCRVADPFDPDYSDNRCCQLNLTGNKPNLYNHHTEEIYFLENKPLIFGKVALPLGYFVTSDNQIWLETDIGSGDNIKTKQTFICHNLVAVTAIIENIRSGFQKVEVTFRDNRGFAKPIVVPRETIAGKDIISLANFGILVDTNNQKQLSRYFTAQINANPDMPNYVAVSQLGFIKVNSKEYFICGNGCLSSEGFLSFGDPGLPMNLTFDDNETYEIASAINSHGSEDKYIEMLKSLNKYPYVKLVLGAAIISLLLNKLNIKNFVLNLAQFTSTGKTTVQQLAASLLGNPDKLVIHWDFTKVGLERYSSILNNFPVILDDTKTINARKPEDVSKVIRDTVYTHVEGKGKIRSNTKLGIRDIPIWSNVMITSSEFQLLEKVNDGGIVGRIIDLTGYPFNEQSRETREIVKKIEEVIEENYGFAVITIMKSLMANDWEKLVQYKNIFEAYKEHYEKMLISGIGGRLAKSSAAIMTGIHILDKELGLKWKSPDSMNLLLKICKAQSNGLTEGERALEYVVEFAKTHKGEVYKYYDRGKLYDEPYCQGSYSGNYTIKREPYSWVIRDRNALYGFIEPKRVAFTSNNLKTILLENGFSYSPVISEWEKRGWLEKEPATKNNPQFTFKGTKYRCVTINHLGLKITEEKTFII